MIVDGGRGRPRRARLRRIPVFALTLAAVAASLQGPLAAQAPDDIEARAGRFDGGKMWTFEYPPAEYFTETYGFDASPEWFERIRLSVLRIPGCSASFVSTHGLVATNHHCVRGAAARVTRPGERLLDDGFVATTLEEERPIPDYRADRLIAVEDVSDEVFAALDAVSGDVARERARNEAIRRIDQRLRAEHPGEEIHVQVIPLYHGGRYSAYVFRRFSDVRLVAAVELQAGFFGGDPDNFTYPRYALDFAFLRVYEDGRPVATDRWLTFGREGVEEGDVVFVVGNPGSTSRLATVAQLEFQRDVHVPAVVAALDERLDALRSYYAEDPGTGEALDLRNRAFSLSNSLKAYRGRLDALRTPVILARKADAERSFADSLAADPELSARYGHLLDSIAQVQEGKAALADRHGAFLLLGSPLASSNLVRRAFIAAVAADGPGGTDPEELRWSLATVPDQPRPLERRLVEARMAGLLRHMGREHPMVRDVLGGRAPAEAAQALLEVSALADSAGAVRAAAAGTLDTSDPGVRLGEAILGAFRDYQEWYGLLAAVEDELEAELGRARFEVYGTSVPPDGTSSPRITDGVVRGYAYNGTLAPPYTTFFGMYDHYHSYGKDTDWDLPDRRWLPPPAALDLETPLNFVSTADTYGGNSGSPAITPDLALVGLNFDRTIEGLSRDYIYLPERGRNIMVDSRAVLEALDDVYDADRIVGELLTGRLFETEMAADGAGPFRR